MEISHRLTEQGVAIIAVSGTGGESAGDQEFPEAREATHRELLAQEKSVELGADDAQADFPVLYGSGLDGWFVRDLHSDKPDGMAPLFETIIEHVPPPKADADAPFLMQISTLAWSDYVGRIGCGHRRLVPARVGAEEVERDPRGGRGPGEVLRSPAAAPAGGDVPASGGGAEAVDAVQLVGGDGGTG